MIGQKLGPYEIVAKLGEGGMGEVYRARDTRLHRQVAIKILPSGSGVDPHFRERFDRETRAVAALSHPNIVAIYDVGTHDGAPYAAIELLEGDTLGARIGTSPLPLRTALDYAVQIARGLAAAHGRGIVHRDLKPGNIFVTPDNQVKILDFGLATQAVADQSDESTRLAQTERGTVLGTVGYMSPEQARGERADERSDIFSFGCVLYEMVAARRAFTGDSRIETLHAILKEHPPDLAASGRDIPPALDRLIMHCLEKAPESRFQNARDLVFALETLTDVSARPTGATPASPRPARRGAVAAVIAAVVIAGGGALWWKASRDTPPSEPKPAAATAADPRWVLAVLPFENVTRDGSPGYFAAGMTDEVTSRLSKLSALRIVGRAAVAAFKSGRSDLPGMVKELGIGSLVTGTVREDGSRVRVNVELMDARSGQVIWSEQYDREGVDVFSAQSDIALRIAEALQATVTLEEQSRVGKRPTGERRRLSIVRPGTCDPGGQSGEAAGTDRSPEPSRCARSAVCPGLHADGDSLPVSRLVRRHLGTGQEHRGGAQGPGDRSAARTSAPRARPGHVSGGPPARITGSDAEGRRARPEFLVRACRLWTSAQHGRPIRRSAALGEAPAAADTEPGDGLLSRRHAPGVPRRRQPCRTVSGAGGGEVSRGRRGCRSCCRTSISAGAAPTRHSIASGEPWTTRPPTSKPC